MYKKLGNLFFFGGILAFGYGYFFANSDGDLFYKSIGVLSVIIGLVFYWKAYLNKIAMTIVVCTSCGTKVTWAKFHYGGCPNCGSNVYRKY